MTSVDSQQALFANEAFYLAFTQKDYPAMDSLWARDRPLICVHPGWRRLTERAAIMQSWQQILDNPRQPGMDFLEPTALAYPGMTLVTCYEALPDGNCLATNGFTEEDGRLRMVLHHSGPCGPSPQ